MAAFLVTGGCGFIGSHLVDALLQAGHRVRVLDDLSTGHRTNIPDHVEVIVGDVGDGATVNRAMSGMDGCYHLAAVASVQRSTEEWAATHRTNLTGSINVFDAARAEGKGQPLPVVFASSAAIFGDNTDLPLNEDSSTLPISPYGADKLGSELHARAAYHVFGSKIIGLRFFNIFGPRQDPGSPYSGVISIFVNRAMRGDDITIFGDGEQTRDFVYVGDVVRYLTAAMSRLEACGAGMFAAYNICRGVSVSINQLAQTVVEICDKGTNISYGAARSGDIRASLGDPARVQADLAFIAETTLADGLRETIEWAKGDGQANLG